MSCQESENERVGRLVREWTNKEIMYPSNMKFQILGKDTNYFRQRHYSIATYVDSIGCLSCKLQLPEWKRFIAQLDSLVDVPVLFFMHPKDKKEMFFNIERDNFMHPVCIDEKDTFNKLNHFPEEMMFQTFLLDKDNKVVAIGNPIHNHKVKELYLKIILGDKFTKEEVSTQTTVTFSGTIVDLGKFDWHYKQNTTFSLTNTGNLPLVITDVITSCGCTAVDYEKEPVRSGSRTELKVQYKADHPEYFDKTITVYCNAETSPIKLRITGNAE